MFNTQIVVKQIGLLRTVFMSGAARRFVVSFGGAAEMHSSSETLRQTPATPQISNYSKVIWRKPLLNENGINGGNLSIDCEHILPTVTHGCASIMILGCFSEIETGKPVKIDEKMDTMIIATQSWKKTCYKLQKIPNWVIALSSIRTTTLNIKLWFWAKYNNFQHFKALHHFSPSLQLSSAYITTPKLLPISTRVF